MLGSLLCPHGSSSVLLDPYGSTISETTSEAWSVEVLPSDSGTNFLPFPRLLHCLHLGCALRVCWLGTYCGLGMGVVGVDRTLHLLMLHSKPRKKGDGGWRDRVRTSVIVFLCTCLSFSVDLCCAGRRQLRVPLEGPPGVFAPVVEQCVGGGRGKQLSSVRFISLKRSIALLQCWCVPNHHLGPNHPKKIIFSLSRFLQVKSNFVIFLLIRIFFLNHSMKISGVLHERR